MSKRERQPLPRAIANAPQLEPGLELFYYAFLELTTERQIGFAEGPIPTSKIYEYCARNEIYEDQQEDLVDHVRSLDTAYLAYRRAQVKET